MNNSRGNFSSKLGLILASAGSAVGLGNLWRFPTETGQHGGSAFLIVYLICVVCLGLPVMISEFVIGRSAHVSVGRAYSVLAPGSRWKWVGRLEVLTPFLILCYYNVVAGWTLRYAWESATGGFVKMASSGAGNAYESFFASFVSSAWQPVVCLFLFMAATHFVVVQGVSKGIERWSKVLMPGLFLILLLLVVSALTMSGAAEGLAFLFKPDFSKVDASVVLSAMGQAFFSLSLGMGILTTYASYFNDDADLGKSALSISAIDTFVAILAGMFIFPAVFTAGVAPSEGSSLLFIALPNVFQSVFGDLWILSYIVSLAFYLLLIVATLTSTISIHEAVTSYLVESFEWSRCKAATVVSCLCGSIGVLCALSIGAVPELTIGEMSLFDAFDYVTAKWLLPMGGLFITLFAGWRLSKQILLSEMTNRGTKSFALFKLLVFAIKWFCPVGIVLVFLNELDLLSF